MMKIPFSPPDIGQQEIDAVVKTMKSAWITTGPKVEELSQRVAQLCGVEHAVCMNSATACMEMGLRLLEIGEGDEVIVPAYTYSASASVITHVGAKPVLVDIEKGKYNISYDAVRAAVTPRTKAVFPVDIGGVICDYDKLYEIAESTRSAFSPNNSMQEAIGRLIIFADGAHSLLAQRNDGKRTGELADFTSFSLHAVKNLTTAEGGLLVWKPIDGFDSAEMKKQLMLYACHGQDRAFKPETEKPFWEYDIRFLGYKHNMTDILASIGLVQLDRAEEILAKRRHIFERFNEALIGMDGVEVLDHFKTLGSSCHLYMVRFPERGEEFRNKFMDRMLEEGVSLNVHYKPLPMHTAYKNLGFDIKDYPNTYEMFKSEVTLPSYSTMTEEEIDYVIDTFGKVYSELK